MLTGQPPFRAETVLETIEQVVSREPVPPGRLREKVPRDLETICLKCLQKDPRRRYASALDLAEDLRRFRADEPIQGRPVSAAERALKWVRRRPALAALALICVLAGLGLVAGGVWHDVRLRAERDRAEANYQRAEKNFERARLAVEEMLTEVAEEQLAYEPRMEHKRRALLEKALGFYQEFLREKGSDPALRKATALAHKRVADISRLLRLDGRAEKAYGQAIALLGELAAESPSEPALRQLLAESHNFRGEVLRLGDRPVRAKEAYEEALRIQRELVADFPEAPAYVRDQARTLYNLGIVSRSTNKAQEAKAQFGEAVALLEGLATRYPGNPEYRQHLARVYLNQGPVLRVTDGFAKARASYDRSITLLEGLHRRYPYVPDYQHELGVVDNNLGILLAGAGRYPEAGAAHQSALTVFGRLVANFPGVPDYRKELANTHNGLGVVRARERAWSEAEQHFGQARKLFGDLVGEFADVADYQAHLGMTLGNLAWLRTERSEWRGARPLIEESVARLKSALRTNPENAFFRQALRAQYQSLAETLVRLGEHGGAAEAATALPEVLHDRSQDYYYAACFLARCVPLAAADERLEGTERRQAAARRHAGRAVAMLREALQRDCKGLQRLPNEAEVFRPLEARDDFRRLRAELQARTGPAPGKPVP
jgi:tetratricopeptide (TPR) repeat protein